MDERPLKKALGELRDSPATQRINNRIPTRHSPPQIPHHGGLVRWADKVLKDRIRPRLPLRNRHPEDAGLIAGQAVSAQANYVLLPFRYSFYLGGTYGAGEDFGGNDESAPVEPGGVITAALAGTFRKARCNARVPGF